MPQLYVGIPPAAGEPPRQLKAFTKFRLDKGSSRRVRFTLGPRAFAHWDDGWKVTPGCYRVLAGSSFARAAAASARGAGRRARLEVDDLVSSPGSETDKRT